MESGLPLQSPFLLLDDADSVYVLRFTVEPGMVVDLDGTPWMPASTIPLGHKVARVDIRKGELVLRYGAPIGRALCEIRAGEHVHTHNLESLFLPTYTLDGINPYLKVMK